MLYTLITGASKGIGKAFAYECAARGMNLILVARSGQLLQELGKDISMRYNVNVRTHTGDLLDHAIHKKIFEWINENGFHVNMLINNAGMGYYGKFEQQPLEKHLEVMHLNMDAQIKLAHEFLNSTNPNQKRYLLNTVSTGAFQPVGYMAVYCASKAFMLSFTRALRYELRKEQVNVTALCPGGTETEFFSPAQMDTVASKNAMFMMKADKVAKQGLDGLLANNAVVIPGWYNKLGAFSARHAPQGLVVWQATNFFKPE
jgi:short-subunit dehydrogenase